MAVTKAEVFRKATLELQKAQTELTKAETARLYVSMGVLRPADVRKRLVNENYLNLQASHT